MLTIQNICKYFIGTCRFYLKNTVTIKTKLACTFHNKKTIVVTLDYYNKLKTQINIFKKVQKATNFKQCIWLKPEISLNIKYRACS